MSFTSMEDRRSESNMNKNGSKEREKMYLFQHYLVHLKYSLPLAVEYVKSCKKIRWMNGMRDEMNKKR